MQRRMLDTWTSTTTITKRRALTTAISRPVSRPTNLRTACSRVLKPSISIRNPTRPNDCTATTTHHPRRRRNRDDAARAQQGIDAGLCREDDRPADCRRDELYPQRLGQCRAAGDSGSGRERAAGEVENPHGMVSALSGWRMVPAAERGNAAEHASPASPCCAGPPRARPSSPARSAPHRTANAARYRSVAGSTWQPHIGNPGNHRFQHYGVATLARNIRSRQPLSLHFTAGC